MPTDSLPNTSVAVADAPPWPAPAEEAFQAGRQARQRGDQAAAIKHFRAVLREQPDHIPAQTNLANALQSMGEIDEALVIAQQTIALAPNKAVLHSNLGGLWQIKGDVEQAIAAYQRAIALDPKLHLAHANLAKALTAQGQFQSAQDAYQDALRLKPYQPELHLELGQLYQRYGFVPQAVEHYRVSLRLAPSAQAYNALGAALQDWGNLKQAQPCYRRALKLKPDFDLPALNLAQMQENLGDLEGASRYYQHALATASADAPNRTKLRLLLETVRRKQADWDDYPQRLAALREALQRHLQREHGEPLPLGNTLAFALPPAWRRDLAVQFARQQAQLAEALATPLRHPREPRPARLRIGYLSPDFRCHAVGTLIAGLFQYHQRPDFEIFAYSLTAAQDDWTTQIRQGCDHFLDVSQQPDLSIAQRIHADGIHILIDLAGYTTYCRPLVLALRPAPVQIQWLGYPGTLGAEHIPYLLADRHLIPEEQAAQYSETLLELPHAWGTTPWTSDAPTPARAACGLPESGMVYCCFNGVHKIDPEVFALWMRILAHVPDSVLWLLDGGAGGSSARLRQAAAAAGIAPERLIFADKRPHAEYLARYRLADLFLDTLAYNAGATAVGALAMGLPLLTCPGAHYATRMGASLCHAVGLPELICATPEAYVEQAVALGRDPERLAALKARLQDHLASAPLFQPQVFVASLEGVYRNLWQRHAAMTA
ncbi:lipoprotein NlpI [Thiorhodovibrio winogradskyi]|uniref:protein O-GlcNAc transferase n=1 Tax=Thiorhodovibrio winogradskyi TaxID=77007 RepID=A0ABZ0SG69_9GAMM|nr:tetratricopeptide repeat protein [Thiorhodovibrio winogradskyi]